jgi:zinc/manganese transport system ATP-binding protein
MAVLAAFEDLTLGYGRRPAVHHLTGAVEAGARLALVGPNGAGKSTLLKGLAGALKPLAGAIRFPGGRAPRIGYLPQQADIDRRFPIRAFDFVAMGLWPRRGALSGFSHADLAQAGEAMAAVGLAGFEGRALAELSGGQLQRLLFARLLLQQAELLLLDEPFTAIDAATTADLLALVQRWSAEGRTILCALHDLSLVRALFPETLLLAREAVAWGPTGATLAPDNLARAQMMGEAWISGAAPCARPAARAP